MFLLEVLVGRRHDLVLDQLLLYLYLLTLNNSLRVYGALIILGGDLLNWLGLILLHLIRSLRRHLVVRLLERSRIRCPQRHALLPLSFICQLLAGRILRYLAFEERFQVYLRDRVAFHILFELYPLSFLLALLVQSVLVSVEFLNYLLVWRQTIVRVYQQGVFQDLQVLRLDID